MTKELGKYAEARIIRTKVPAKDRRCFQMHVSHHVRDLGYKPKQAVAIAFAEERAGKLKGVCSVRKLRKLS